MEDQEVSLNDVQKAICEKFALRVERDDDGFVVIDRDPVLRARKVKLPQHRGTDLDSLIMQARSVQQARNGEVVESEVVESVEPEVVESVEPEVVESQSNVVTLRRVVITEEDRIPPAVLTNVVLDDSSKKIRTPKPEKKHRDNRYARAFRALLENPDASVTEQARVADVSEDMFRWYHITFRHVDRILREMYGEDCIPKLPDLND